MDIKTLESKRYDKIHLIKTSDIKWEREQFFIRKYSSSTDLHRHEYMQINYISKGSGTHFINNNEFTITKGDIFVIPPYIPHRIISNKDEKLQIVEFEFVPVFINEGFEESKNLESFFDFAYIEPFFVSESKLKPRLNLVGTEQMEVENLLDEVYMEYREKRQGYSLVAKSLLLKLLVIVGRRYSSELESSDQHPVFERYRDKIYESIEYINSNYMNEFKLDEIARKFYFSPSYFSYLFKCITGKTFVEYVNNLRISKAMELLVSTDKKIIEISFDIGFNNVTHLNRLFKRATGLTPVQYRKSRS